MKCKLSTILTILLFSISSFAASSPAYDSNFGVAGFVQTDIFQTDNVFDLKAQKDGKIVVAGRNGSNNFVIARYTSTGNLDTSFSNDGLVITDFFGETDLIQDICIQNDNKIVAIGLVSQAGNTIFGLSRYNPDGSLDTTFDGDGKATFDLPSFPRNCAVQSDNKLLFIFVQNGHIATARLNTNGSLDTTFGTGGIVITNPLNAPSSQPESIGIQPDGKIVVVGSRSSFAEGVIVRYNPDGTLDTTFSSDGILILNFSAGSDILNSVAFQSNGSILISVAQVGNVTRIVRLQSNGNLDTTFGTSGSVSIDIPNSASDASNQIFILSDEKILVSGVNIVAGLHILFRLNATNGSLDTQFGTNGFFSNKRPKITLNFEVDVINNKIFSGFSSSNGDFSIEAFNLDKTPINSADFDGDGFPDTAVYRPSTGNWFILRSSDNSFQAFLFGLNGDIPIDGDFDGDGKSDLAIFRPSTGVWFFQRSSDGTNLGVTFGNSTDKPIPGDYDKDGKTDIAVFRPSTGEWLILRSSTNFSTFFGYPFGQNGDIPISSERK